MKSVGDARIAWNMVRWMVVEFECKKRDTNARNEKKIERNHLQRREQSIRKFSFDWLDFSYE